MFVFITVFGAFNINSNKDNPFFSVTFTLLLVSQFLFLSPYYLFHVIDFAILPT